MSVGRNPQEVLRVLDALQTDELCPCNWQKGEEVLKPAPDAFEIALLMTDPAGDPPPPAGGVPFFTEDNPCRSKP